jgi:hypothetical protein
VIRGDLVGVGQPAEAALFVSDSDVAGSALFVSSLLAPDLVDALRMGFPVVLGGGKPLFADGADMTLLQLVVTRQTGAVAILALRREG